MAIITVSYLSRDQNIAKGLKRTLLGNDPLVVFRKSCANLSYWLPLNRQGRHLVDYPRLISAHLTLVFKAFNSSKRHTLHEESMRLQRECLASSRTPAWRPWSMWQRDPWRRLCIEIVTIEAISVQLVQEVCAGSFVSISSRDNSRFRCALGCLAASIKKLSMEEEGKWWFDSDSVISSNLIALIHERWRCCGLQRRESKSCSSEEVHRSGGPWLRSFTQIMQKGIRRESLGCQRDE